VHKIPFFEFSHNRRNLLSLLFVECSPKLVQRDILQLSDSLSGDAEFLTDYFESFRVAAVQPEALGDNLPLAVVQHLQ